MIRIPLAFVLALATLPSHAQTVIAAPAPTVDLTGIATAVIAGVFTLLGIIVPLMIQSRVKDKAAAETLSNAVKNSLGAMQQAATQAVVIANPQARIPGLSPTMQVGLQYALDHAGDEAERLGITPAAVADKINAQIGLTNIATNIATASSPAPSPLPLSAVPVPIAVPPQTVPLRP